MIYTTLRVTFVTLNKQNLLQYRVFKKRYDKISKMVERTNDICEGNHDCNLNIKTMCFN